MFSNQKSRTWKGGYDFFCVSCNFFVARVGCAANDLHFALQTLNSSPCEKNLYVKSIFSCN